MQFSTVIDQFAYCLRLTALYFCMCHGLNTWNILSTFYLPIKSHQCTK